MNVKWNSMDHPPAVNGWYWLTSSEGEVAVGFWAHGWHLSSASLPPTVHLVAYADMELPEPCELDPPVVQLDIEGVVHNTRKS